MGEGNADAVGAEGPVERVGGRGEVCEEGDGVGEVEQFGVVDRGEAVVVECALVFSQLVCRYCHFDVLGIWTGCDLRGQSVHPQSGFQLLRFKRADASSETLVSTPWRYLVPCHEQGMFFFFGWSRR